MSISTPFNYSCVSYSISSFNVQFLRNLRDEKSIRATKKSKDVHLTAQELEEGCRLGMDSHADMTCIGAHAHIYEVYEGQTCNVFPFNDSYDPIANVKTVNAAFAYDSEDGQTYILNVCQALDFSKSMKHSLLCPNQARVNGVVIDDIPKFIDYHGHSSFSIFFPEQQIRLPLSSSFPTSYLHVRRPSVHELDTCPDLELTSAEPWEPELFDNPSLNVFSLMRTDPLRDLGIRLQQHCVVSAITHIRGKSLSPDQLSKLWGIGLRNAKNTIEHTSQDYLRILQSGPISKRVKTRAHPHQYNQLGGYLGHFASDTFKANVTSLKGHKYTQLFCNNGNYTKNYNMKEKGHAHHALDGFFHDVGIPSEILTDGAKELTLGEWSKKCRKHRVHQRTTEPHTPWQNIAELVGGIVKRKVRRLMKSKNVPIVLWDYCWTYVCALRTLTCTDNIHLDGHTPFSKIHHYSPDISEFITFSFFDWVWYHDPRDPDRSLIGRWLGPAHDIGQGFAYHILTEKGTVKTRSSVAPITDTEMQAPDLKVQLEHFTQSMESVIGNHTKATTNKCDDVADDPYSNLFEDDELDDEDIEFQERRQDGTLFDRPELDDISSDPPIAERTDNLIGVQASLPHPSGTMQNATVVGRKRNHDGSLVGTHNENPLLNTGVYEVQFHDGTYDEYAANVITENLFEQMDDYGFKHSILSCITDHQCDTDVAVPKDQGTFLLNGVQRKRITTKGWKLKVEWRDGTSSWIPLKTLKESNPVETAEYAVAHDLQSFPAFAWWVPYTLKKRDRVIKQVQHRAVKRKIMYGVEVPESVDEAYKLDEKNGNDFWDQAIKKELKNVIVAFQLLNDGEVPPIGSKKIDYHFVFTVKIDLTRKARLVAGGHRHKDVPSYDCYSTVVSRDSVRIIFTIAALNGLNLRAADVGNAYLNAPNKERVHVTCGPELYGPEAEGKTAIVVRALYGLKSAGNAWRHYFSNYIRNELGYDMSVADNDVYMKAKTTADGFKYYSYIVCYVDDILVTDFDPGPLMKRIGSDFRLKDDTDSPKTYLGTDIKTWKYSNEDGEDCSCWAIGSEKYSKEAISICESLMKQHNLSYTSTRRHGRKTPFNSHLYRPELDTSNYCSAELHTVFQNLIGVLRWISELGRIDITYEVSILSQYLAQPRVGHLQQVLNIFFYLKHNNKCWLPLDPTRFDINYIPRNSKDLPPLERARAMKELYPDATETLPHNMPEARGETVDINVFVDADHAGNQVTRRSHTGIIIMINMSPIIWFSKRQNTVETSTFGSEFIALKIATELTESLRYKLRMFGVPISGPARVFCDNESVVNSSSFPDSRLKKKHCSVAYHKVRECIAAGTLLIYYEQSSSNLADLLTKLLPANKREPLVTSLLTL